VADKELIAHIDKALENDPEPVKALAGEVDTYVAGLKEMNIRDWVVRDQGYGLIRSLWRYLSLMLTFPFFLFGFITNALPYLLPVHLVRNLKDRQFHSSVKAFLGILLLFPLVYALETLAVGLVTGGPWWIWTAFLVSLIPMGKIALTWYLRWKKTVRGSWFRRQFWRKKEDATRMVQLREEILVLTEQLIGG